MTAPLLTGLADALTCSAADPADANPPPGAVVGLVRGDETWLAAAGNAQRLPDAEPVSFDSDTRSDVGSVTKIIATTAALMRLVDDGAVELDASVESIIATGLPGDVTVADLLEHQAGLWEWWPLYLSARTPQQAWSVISELPQRYPRRSGRHYSDLGFMLLGRLIARVGGAPLDRVCGELIFEPYGMSATRFAEPVGGAPVAASSYGDRIEQTMISTGRPYPVRGRVDDFDGWRGHPLVGEVNDGNSFHAHRSCAGHAGVFSTAPDLLRFGRVILDCLAGPGPIRRSTVLEFITAGDDPGQGLGWRIWETPAGPAIGHTGFPGVGFAIFPDHDAACAMITNRLHVSGQPANLESLWRTTMDSIAAELNDLAGER